MVYHLLILQYSANLSGPYCALDSLVSVSKTRSMCLIVRDIISLEICLIFYSYIDTHDASCVTPDAGKYGPFYSVCQVS